MDAFRRAKWIFPKRYFFCGSFMFFLSCDFYTFAWVYLYVPCGHQLGKGWPLGSRLWSLTVSFSLSHWYPGSVVILDCINCWYLPLTYFDVQPGQFFFSVKQLKFEIYIISVYITLSFLLGSENKNKFGEMDIFRLQFPFIKLWKVILNSVNLMFVLFMEYIRGWEAPQCIFHNKHKTLYYLFSPDPAVSCVADTQVSHREICILCNILLHFNWEF